MKKSGLKVLFSAAFLVILTYVVVNQWSSTPPKVTQGKSRPTASSDKTPSASPALLNQSKAMNSTGNSQSGIESDELFISPEFSKQSFIGDLKEIKKRKELRALVTYGKADFFMRNGGLHGIQVDLLRHLEKDLNKGIRQADQKVKLRFIPVSFDQLIPALQSGKGDIAAAFLTATPQRSQVVNISSAAQLIANEILVTHKDILPPQELKDLAGKELYLLKNSSYVEHVKQLNAQLYSQNLEPIKIIEADANLLSEDLLEMVNSGSIEMTMIDDFKGQLWQRVLPNLRLHHKLTLRENTQLGWAVRKNNPELFSYINSFISRKAKKGTLLGNMLFNQYYKNTQWIKSNVQNNARDRFNQLAPLFKKYAKQYDFDFLALAAQGYQESKLNNDLISHRGAIGIMQLLPSTAKDMGIDNIKQAEQNIMAGAKYMDWIRKHHVNQTGLSPENQLALSWAAYNAGPATLRKMRSLAQQMGLDPNVWFGNVELAAGKIVGSETVLYVSNIYKYYVAYHMAFRETKNTK